MQPLFDAHNHLPNTDAAPPLHLRVVCGTCEADWEAVLAHSASLERVVPMLGLHPWQVTAASPEWSSKLQALLRAHRTGIGECGLDFAQQETETIPQEAACRVQLRLAHDLHRPVALHVVKAWGRILELLRHEGVPSAGAMVHAFSGSPESARAVQAMGVFLSFNGDLLKPDHVRMREALRAVRAEHLLLETDGSADLAAVIAAAADIRRVSTEELATQTWENGQRYLKELLG